MNVKHNMGAYTSTHALQGGDRDEDDLDQVLTQIQTMDQDHAFHLHKQAAIKRILFDNIVALTRAELKPRADEHARKVVAHMNRISQTTVAVPPSGEISKELYTQLIQAMRNAQRKQDLDLFARDGEP